MDITVIIPTFNRSGKITATLQALASQSLPAERYQAIIVDDGSGDDTRDLVQGFFASSGVDGWKLVALERNGGRAAALNAGVREASTPLLLFTDDDIVPSRGWVEAHLRRHLETAKGVGIVGAVKYPDDWIARSNLVRYHNSRYLGQDPSRPVAAGEVVAPSRFAGGNTSLPRQVMVAAGMFNERLRRGQDVELALRLEREGLPLLFEPKAVAVHYADAVWSYQRWLQAFQNFYRDSAQHVLALHPDRYRRWCHWFVERPEWGKEAFRDSMVKAACRGVARPALGRLCARWLEAVDGVPQLYLPLLYRYFLTCSAIEGVNTRPTKGGSPCFQGPNFS